MRTNPTRFACADNGYDKAQVDQYIQKLSEDYRNVMTKQTMPTIEMVVQALERVEDKAAELIEDVKSETMQRFEALEKAVWEMRHENYKLIAEINCLIEKLDIQQTHDIERKDLIA